MKYTNTLEQIIQEAHSIRLKSDESDALKLSKGIQLVEMDKSNAYLLLRLMTSISEKNGMVTLNNNIVDNYELMCG